MAPPKEKDDERHSKAERVKAARARKKRARAEKRDARAEARSARVAAREAKRGDGDDVAHEEADADETTYTIDQLSAHTNIPSRTIRFYQSQKILDRPKRRGRVAVYTDSHVDRLQLIAKLQDRGLRIRGMKQLLARPDADAAVRDWLGLSEKLSGAWTEERPKILSEDEMTALIGDRPAGTLAAIVRSGLAERPEDAPHSYFVPSPGLLDSALQLLDAGLSIEVLAELEPILREGLSETARKVVDYFATNLDEAELPGAIDALRKLGNSAIGIIFAQEIERTLTALLEGGPARKRAKNPSRQRRQRRR